MKTIQVKGASVRVAPQAAKRATAVLRRGGYIIANYTTLVENGRDAGMLVTGIGPTTPGATSDLPDNYAWNTLSAFVVCVDHANKLDIEVDPPESVNCDGCGGGVEFQKIRQRMPADLYVARAHRNLKRAGWRVTTKRSIPWLPGRSGLEQYWIFWAKRGTPVPVEL